MFGFNCIRNIFSWFSSVATIHTRLDIICERLKKKDAIFRKEGITMDTKLISEIISGMKIKL